VCECPYESIRKSPFSAKIDNNFLTIFSEERDEKKMMMIGEKRKRFLFSAIKDPVCVCENSLQSEKEKKNWLRKSAH
jgi:hypothetical protein